MNLKELPRRTLQAVRHRLGLKPSAPPVDPAIQRFMDFCRRKWPAKTVAADAPVVLVGLFPSHASAFCYAYVTNFLAAKFGAAIESYQFVGSVSPTLRETFASFGARFALGMKDAGPHKARATEEAKIIFAGLKSRRDLLEVAVEGIVIGDQIYDSYLRFYNEPTVELTDPRLLDVIVQSLLIFHTAKAYLARTKVAAFITDDYSYINSGIFTRLMFAAKVPIYMVAWGEKFWIIRLNPNPSGAGHGYPPPAALSYYGYPQLFDRLTPSEKEAGLAKARKALEERLSGAFCPLVRMPGSAYGASTGERVLADGPEPRILVLLHDFIDSPHGYRHLLFPDFRDWIYFLLERAERTPYRWYVKPHPCLADSSRAALNAANKKVLLELQQRFPKIHFLPETASNRQILADGVSALFTVHGSAGHEFAYRGIPAVNAGDNPHIAYHFNFHAQSTEEYADLIDRAGQLQITIDQKEIEEFFYMNYYFFTDHCSSPENPINETLFAAPDCSARFAQPAIFDVFIADSTPERERGVTNYFEQFFGGLENRQIP